MDGVRPALASGTSVVAWMPVLPQTQYPPRLLRQLSLDERHRAERFPFQKDRTIFIAARRLLACMVDTALPGTMWRLAASTPNDKPKLDVADGRQLFVNLAHTDGCVVVALHATAQVGVDVEAARDVGDVADLVKLTMTARETIAIASRLPHDAIFRRLWVRKEAVLKAFGVGLAGAVTEIDVLDPSHVRLPPKMACPLTLLDLNDIPYDAALCVLAPNVPVYPVGLAFDETRETLTNPSAWA